MAGTLCPYIFAQFTDNNGNPAAGYQLFTYAAGTSTKLNTYSDAALATAHTNPVILDSAGRAVLFLSATTYRFVLATPSDTDPPTSPVQDWDDVAAVPGTASSPDVTGTFGDTAVLGDVMYLSDGSGGKTSGRWYLADATATLSSTLPSAIGMSVGPTNSGSTGTVRLLGQLTGLSSLSVGTVYYIDTTPGQITSAAPANARAVGVADSTTSMVLSQWVTVPLASATVPGIVGVGAQTFAGDKTWQGFLHSAKEIVSTSPSAGIGYATGAGIAPTQSTNKSTTVTANGICGSITMNAAALNATTFVSFTFANTSIAATDVVLVSIKSGATAGAYDVSVEATAANSCVIGLYNKTAGPLSEAVVLNFAVVKAVTS